MKRRPGKWFTVVFEGDIAAFPSNPLKVDTVFGIPETVAHGDAFAERDALEEERDGLRKALETAIEALVEIAGDPVGLSCYQADAAKRALATLSVSDADGGGQ